MNADFSKLDKKAVIKSLAPFVDTVLKATALYEVEREACDKIQQALLDSGKFGPIRDLKDTFLMAESDAANYYPALDAAYKAAGYDLKPGYCPALIADTLKVKAERALVDAAKPIFGFDADMCMTAKNGFEEYKKAIRLLVGLVLAGKRGN